MLRLGLSLRFLALIAALGAALGALLMFWEGGIKLFGAVHSAFTADETGEKSIIPSVMRATDALLFGIVLLIFAHAITFGFVFSLPVAMRGKLPPWMRIEGISELKQTLIEVVLVYLVVDFATNVAEEDTHLSWDLLGIPVSIFLIAGALRLVGGTHPEHRTEP
jgi:uncharacterized membrane protein YqhA